MSGGLSPTFWGRNKKSIGFRAPTFSLNQKSSWFIDELEKMNYKYDSSIVPAKTNLYGLPNAEKKPYRISSNYLERDDPNGKIIEFPILVTKFLGKKIPAGGGFYLRFLPTKIIKNARQKIPAFKELIDKDPNLKHTIVFCSGEQIDEVQGILNKRLPRPISNRRITQDEPKRKDERARILQEFADEKYQIVIGIQILNMSVIMISE